MEIDPSNIDLPNERFRTISTRLSQNQFGVILDFLTIHPELISASASLQFGGFSRADLRNKWEELATILNSDKTGSQKTVDKWKKCWADLKMMIKNKLAKRNLPADQPINSSELRGVLSKMEEKAWNLMVSQNKVWRKYQKDNSETAGDDASMYPKSVGYIVLNVNGTPLNIPPAHMPDGTTNDSVEASDDMEHSEVLTERQIKLEPELVDVSETSADSTILKEVSSTQTSSSLNKPSFFKKRPFKKFPLNSNMQNLRTLKRRKEENRIIQLLQRQNELLECLMNSVSRIEKSLSDNKSQCERRESAIGNIVNNIDKIAGSLGSMSKSLKTMS